jgi:hypothetical protein
MLVDLWLIDLPQQQLSLYQMLAVREAVRWVVSVESVSVVVRLVEVVKVKRMTVMVMAVTVVRE